jgi:hypothetical protein
VDGYSRRAGRWRAGAGGQFNAGRPGIRSIPNTTTTYKVNLTEAVRTALRRAGSCDAASEKGQKEPRLESLDSEEAHRGSGTNKPGKPRCKRGPR